MTIAKDYASKAGIAFVALAMIFSSFAPAAQAQSSEDLQKMINDLLAQIATLQGQVGQGGNSVASGICPYTWTRDLKTGATGEDVMKLQKFLNSDLDTRVSATGAGSVGMETQFFGPDTAAAVSKFQVKYRAEILSPAGLVNPTGFFGPSTRAQANAKCVVTPTPDEDTTTDEDEDTTDEDTEDVTLSGEASLDTYEADDASDDTIEEGAEDAEVAVFTAQFSDGDAEISRLDVAFTSDDAGADAWNAFETVSLWVDGEKVAEEDASSKDDYLGDEDDGVIRFSNLKLVGMEDEDLEITVAVTAQGSLDAEELSTWTVTTESLRFFDADGVATTDTDLVDEESAAFTLEEAGTDDEVIVKSSTNNPAADTFKVNDDKKSDKTTVFAFDLDTDDSTNDIDVNEVTLTVTVSSSTYNTIVDDAELVIDGVTIDDVTVTAGTTTTATLVFNVDGDVTIDAGDRVEAQLVLTFKSLNSGNEGTTVTSAIVSGNVDAEGADTFTSTGAATGKVHTLRTSGLDVSKKSESAVITTSDGALNDYVTYKVTAEVTAFDQDAFIPIASASTSWNLVDSAGVAISPAPATASTSVVITSSAEVGGAGDAFFEINEGETETVTITVTFTPSLANTAAGLQLNSLRFDETGTVTAADDKTWTALPAVDYRTEVVTVVN